MVRKDKKLEHCKMSTKKKGILQSDATQNVSSTPSGRIEFTDDFMFATIMGQEQEICRKVLECILGFEIESLNYVESQNTIKNGKRAKGIRLDVVAKSTGTAYDIEMQTVNRGHIPRRMRYYQSQIDLYELGSGRMYSELNNSYVIFICTFDLFKKGQYIYEFENYDRKNGLPLGDGSKKIVINSKGTKGDISDELREFIRYIEHPDEVAKNLHTDFIKQIEEKVIEENDNEDWRKSHMTWEMQMKELKHEGREEGKKEGRKEGRKEGLTVGLVRGEKRGLDIATKIFRLFRDGKSEGQIASTVGIDVATVRRVLG